MTAASSFAAAFTSAVASSRESQVAEMVRTVHQLKGTVDSLQSQLDSERMMRTNLEAKVSVIMASIPAPGTLATLDNSDNSAAASSSNHS